MRRTHLSRLRTTDMECGAIDATAERDPAAGRRAEGVDASDRAGQWHRSGGAEQFGKQNCNDDVECREIIRYFQHECVTRMINDFRAGWNARYRIRRPDNNTRIQIRLWLLESVHNTRLVCGVCVVDAVN